MTTTTPTQSLPGRPLRTSIESQLIQMLASPINPDRSNSGKMLWEVYFWQVVAELAKKRGESGWDNLQKAGGIVDDDDRLRELTTGEHICAESNKFSALIKVDDPRMTFNKEKFAQRAARKWSLDADEVLELMDACRTKGKPPLTKRIVETE